MTLLSTVAAWFLSLVFLRALIHKLGHPAEFTGILRQYRLLPNRLAPLAATAVVVSEACAAAGLMLPQSRAAAALLACGLLLVYTAAIGTNLLRGRMSIDCGCGGASQGISRLHVIRNVLLALCAVPAMATASQGPMRFEFSIVTAGSVLAVWFIFLAFDQLLGNRTHALATDYSSF